MLLEYSAAIDHFRKISHGSRQPDIRVQGSTTQVFRPPATGPDGDAVRGTRLKIEAGDFVKLTVKVDFPGIQGVANDAHPLFVAGPSRLDVGSKHAIFVVAVA